MGCRSARVAAGLTAVLLLAGLAACTADEAPPESDTAAPGATAAPSASGTPPAAPPSPSPEELVVISHATVPQLRLSRAMAERLIGGELDRWRGFRVLHDVPTARAVRAVERDPGTLAVVSLDAVGPTVVVATVAGRDPVRDTADAIDVTVVGDLMLVRGVPDEIEALARMRRRLRAADLTVGNLESTLSLRGEPTQGDDSFGATAELIRPLADAGFDALSLANNHTGDYGTRALLDTVRAFDDSPIEPFGAGPDDRLAAQPALLEVDGTTFGFLGFNAIGETPAAGPVQPGALSVRMPPRTGPLVAADLARVTDAIRRTARAADVVVVLPHWGTQYTHTPEPIQRSVARPLVRAGADLVVGGHPHWVQGVDEIDGVPVIHSLGNFVFDMDFMEQTMEGVVLEATFWGAELKAVRFVPYRMDPVSFAPSLVAGPGILADLWSSSTGPFSLP